MNSTWLASAPTQMIPGRVNLRLMGRPFILNLSWGPPTARVYSGRRSPRSPLAACCNTQDVFTRQKSSLRHGATLTRWPLAVYNGKDFSHMGPTGWKERHTVLFTFKRVACGHHLWRHFIYLLFPKATRHLGPRDAVGCSYMNLLSHFVYSLGHHFKLVMHNLGKSYWKNGVFSPFF